MSRLPRGIRNNQPGNVRLSNDRWLGQVWPSPDPEFVVTDTMAHGVRITAKELLSYQANHGLRTIRAIINRWAPPVENDTGAYVAAVSKACGVGADQQITLGEGMLARLCGAIFDHENGPGHVASADIAAGVRMALGLTPSPAP